MNVPVLSSASAEKSLPLDAEAEASRLIEQKSPKPLSQIEADSERIRSSVARLTSNSIEGLEGLASELQQLQSFLKSEVERVQGEIESALAGINIIIEVIAPWKTTTVPVAPPTNGRIVRAGPVAHIESAQSRR